MWTFQNGMASRFGGILSRCRGSVPSARTRRQLRLTRRWRRARRTARWLRPGVSSCRRSSAMRTTISPIRSRGGPCDICGQPLVADEQRRHAGCRKLAQRRATERGYAAVGARKAADAWLFKADARWSSLPELRRQRQAAGLCVVCGLVRQDGRHWCCSREHEKLRRHTLHRVLAS